MIKHLKNIPCLITLLAVLLLQSCTALRPSTDLSVSTDRSAIEFLQNRSESIDGLKAELNLNPSDITIPSIDAYLSYEKKGVFRLIGLSSAGFTLFDIKVKDGVVTGLVENFPVNETFALNTLMEVIDFHGSDSSGEFSWFVEEYRNYYVVNQLRSYGGVSYPLRRWWIDKSEMLIVKKELYSDTPDKHGVRLFEALYRDFKPVNDIMTPFEIIIRTGSGKKAGKVRFKKIEYYEDKK